MVVVQWWGGVGWWQLSCWCVAGNIDDEVWWCGGWGWLMMIEGDDSNDDDNDGVGCLL